MKKCAAALAIAAILASPAWAATRTVRLDVPGMDCPVCPITVKKALTRIEGVSGVTVNFDKRRATVTYDDAKVSVEALTNATRDAGYPSTLKQ